MTRTAQGGGGPGYRPVERLHSVLAPYVTSIGSLSERNTHKHWSRRCAGLLGTDRMGYHGARIAVLSLMAQCTRRLNLASAIVRPLRQMRSGVIPGCARAALSAQDVYMAPQPATGGSCPLYVAYDGRAAVTAPLSHGDRVYGLMGLSMPASCAADGEEVDIVRELAADLGYALPRSRSRCSRRPRSALKHEREHHGRALRGQPIPIPWWMHPGPWCRQCRGHHAC